MDHQQQNNPIIQSPATEPTWTDDDHQLFLIAVVNVPEDTAGRWQKIADGVPGKTADEVKAYYGVLEHELKEIEAGRVELPHYPEDDVEDEVLVSSDTELRTSRISVGCNRVEKERKKGNPWTIEEHRRFLEGLEVYGKGDWRSIARNMVVTRTATQVASHAQKYFLRQKAEKKQKKRSSIHDITTTNTTTTATTATTTTTTTDTTMVVHAQPTTSPPPQPTTPPATGVHGGRKTVEPAPPTSSPPNFSGGQSQPPLAPNTTGIFYGGQPPTSSPPGFSSQPPLPPHTTGIFYGGQPPSPLTLAPINFYGGGGSGGPPPLTPAPVNCYAGDGGERGGAPPLPLTPIDYCWEQGGAPPSLMENIQFQDHMYYSFLS